jgi:hypothetical protein
LLLIAFGLHFPHFYSGVGDVNFDFYIHYNWAKEFADEVRAGNGYPRWSFLSRYGLGEPVFITYSPLYYYAVAAFSALGLTTWASMTVVAALGNAIFAWFVLLAALRFMPLRIALPVACAALLSPFLVILHYKFHGLAWASAGYATHGMLLWALTRERSERGIFNGWAAAAIVLAVGSHIIGALINIVCYSGYAFVRARQTAAPGRALALRPIVGWTFTVAVGLAASAVYLLPALYYRKIIALGNWDFDLGTGAFAWPIFTLPRASWFAIQWPVAAPALVMLGLIAAFVVRRGDVSAKRFIQPMLLVALISALFASELSYPVWTFLNPISQIYLPYRFLSVTYTAAAFCIGLGMVLAQARGAKAWNALFLSSLVFSMVVGLVALLKGSYGDGVPLVAEVIEDRHTFEPARTRFAQPDYFERCRADLKFCVSGDRAAGGFRGLGEYLLIWAKSDAIQYAHAGFNAECARRQSTCTPIVRTPTGFSTSVTAERSTSLVLPVFFYPAWDVSVGGKSVAARPDPETGLLLIELPSGSNRVEVVWRRTPIETGGALCSALVVGLWGLWAIVTRRRTRLR